MPNVNSDSVVERGCSTVLLHDFSENAPVGSIPWLLQPWRTPKACTEGGVALLGSVEGLFHNVMRARRASMAQVYGPESVNSHSRGSSQGRQLTMRSETSQQRLKHSLEVSGGQRITTLLDYTLPSTCQPSHLPPDNASSSSSSSTLAATSTKSRKTMGRADPPRLSNSRKVRAGPLFIASTGCEDGEKEKENSASAVTQNEHNSNHVSVGPTASADVYAHKTHNDSRSGTPVPRILRFDELLREKETLLKQMEKEEVVPEPLRRFGRIPTPSPPSSTPHQCSSLDMSGEFTERGGRSRRGSSPPGSGSYASDVEDAGTARPAKPSGTESCLWCPRESDTANKNSVSIDGGREEGSMSHPSVNGYLEQISLPVNAEARQSREELEEEEVDDSENESELLSEDGNASDDNFGAGGHLACVPGDSLNNRYTLIRQLGVGRSSRVWLAVDLEQCSITRRQLIKELGEEKVRKMFNPKERPLFVAIKVFRCGDMYVDCAAYETRVLRYIRGCVTAMERHNRFCSPALHSALSLNDAATTTPMAGAMKVPNTYSFSLPTGALAHEENERRSPTSTSVPASVSARSSTQARQPVCCYGDRLASLKDHFKVEGEYGSHSCLVMDVVGAGVDTAINETRLKGLPCEVARAIITCALQGLGTLAAMNIIHTDLKPENLLFVDLDPSVAANMAAYQSSHLRTTTGSALWSSSTHRRMSVSKYVRERSSLSRSHSHSERQTAAADGEDGDGGSASAKRVRSVNLDSDERSEESQQERGLYQVQVSDFGLSFLVPPALRAGTVALLEAGGEDLLELDAVAQMDAMRRIEEGSVSAHGEGDLQEEDVVVAGGTPPSSSAPRLTSIAAVRRRYTDTTDESDLDDDELLWRAQGPDLSSGHLVRQRVQRHDGDDTMLPGGSSTGAVDMTTSGPLLHSQTASYCSLSQGAAADAFAAEGGVIRKQDSSVCAQNSSAASAQLDASLLRHQQQQQQQEDQETPALSPSLRRVISEPTALELEILRRQNYARGIVVQSREYRSPEIILGDYFLPSCDVWSLGCIAYELITGRFLFDCAEEHRAAGIEYRRQLRRQAKAEARAKAQHNSSSMLRELVHRIATSFTGKAATTPVEGGSGTPVQKGDSGSSSRTKGNESRSGEVNDATDFLNVGSDESNPEDDDEEEDDESEEDPLPVYYEAYEKDLDVFHLKTIMRLIGPPPLAFINRAPIGLYVDDFYDVDGNFLFFGKDEEVECGCEEAAPYRNAELAEIMKMQSEEDLHAATAENALTDRSSGVDAAGLLSPGWTPGDSVNYPVVTAGWRGMQDLLLEKLDEDAEETQELENFLLKCLQWDPAMRMSAQQLLEERWLSRLNSLVNHGRNEED